MNSEKNNHPIDRRTFVAAASGTAFTFLPEYVLGAAHTKPPSDKLNIAGVGVAGMGASNLARMKGENIVALCDVDEAYAVPVSSAIRTRGCGPISARCFRSRRISMQLSLQLPITFMPLSRRLRWSLG